MSIENTEGIENAIKLEMADVLDISRIGIDVYYFTEKDFKEHNAPCEVIMSFPEHTGLKPVRFTKSLVSCYDVRDTTEELPYNKLVVPGDLKVRTASIDVYGSVNYHVVGDGGLKKDE